MVATTLPPPTHSSGGLIPSISVSAARAHSNEHTEQIASLVAQLGLDQCAIDAALCLQIPAAQCSLIETKKSLGEDVVALALSVQRMALIHHTPSASRTESDRAQQLEAVRKMLLAMVEDVRVVVIKLAERLVTLRALALNPTTDEAKTAAQEVRDLFAPLANRLGIWQLKWELEDQSLRILEPAIYKQIARALDERKADRDAYIEEVKSRLNTEICAAGIEANIAGRAKHITSIWNKMQRKGYQIDELYDIRGVRVLVEDVRACYTVLGLVHNLWTPIPSEFDDYIARPKANNYRSLHTAVVGPNGNALEVQIRTHDMHRASEFGVAAHWRYKEGAFNGANANAGNNASSGKRDGDFEEKLAWLRQVMDWRESVASAGDAAMGATMSATEALKTNLFEESIFVFTPQGRVIDLPKDATAIDFAYHVHSNLGHRCRGARVDGMMVPLNTPLKNGQRVEVQTVKEGGPSRDWLNPELGFVRSARAKSKVRAWFNALQQDETLAQGRAELERFLQREGKTALSLDAIAKAAGLASVEILFNDIAKARINQKEIIELIHKAAGDVATAPQVLEEPILRKARSGGESGILIVGIDKLLTGLAKCCRPAPPDAITGFITKGAGISVHRVQCSNAQRLTKTQPERMIQAQWGNAQTSVFPVGIEVIAIDRQGLLRDVSEALSKERINVTAVNTHSKDLRAKMRFTGEIKDVEQLRKALSAVLEVKGVLEARRV
jgi:GTP pyrophosphokinase